jgi:L-asparaginase
MEPMSDDRPTVALVATGGTIENLGRDRLDLAWYGDTDEHRSVAETITATPELAKPAAIRHVPFPSRPSHTLATDDLLALGRLLRELCEDPGLTGVVITHGTNTLEETAFFLSLVCPPTIPIVLTGALRPASALSADGPLNLVNAVRLAASPQSAGRGVMVCLDHAVHTARHVTKASTYRPGAFQAGELGPVGYVEPDGAVVFHYGQQPSRADGAFDARTIDRLPRVDIVMSYIGADADHIEASVNAGAGGIVCAGTGAGIPTATVATALRTATKTGVVVCMATRVPSGRVLARPDPTDAFVAAGGLPPWKARLLLALALTRSTEPHEIQRYFDQ